MAKVAYDSEELEALMIGTLMLALYEDGFTVKTEDNDDGNLWLRVRQESHARDGWIRLMPGNGIDVIVDHSAGLEHYKAIKETSALHDQHAD